MRLTVIAVAVGLVLGAGGTGLVWMLSSDDKTGADELAQQACDSIPAGPIDPRKPEPEVSRLLGAAALAHASAVLVPKYTPLADTLNAATRIYQETFSASGPEFDGDLEKAREFCVRV